MKSAKAKPERKTNSNAWATFRCKENYDSFCKFREIRQWNQV
jgi:hypothetical protein